MSSYPPNRARLSEYALNLVNALADLDSIDVLYLLADKTSYPIETVIHNPKIKVLRIWKADSISSIFRVMRFIAKIKPDIVHFNVSFQSFGRSKLTNFVGLSLINLCRRFGFHVLAGVHTLADMADLEKFNVKPNLLNKVGILVATKTVLTAQTVAVLVKGYSEFLRQRYHHKGVIFVPHGATVEDPPIDHSKKVILLFGHMGPHKGLPVMLEAFKKVRCENNNVRLIVAGTNHPNYPNYLHQFKQKCVLGVEYTGYVPHEKLGSVFGEANVVVLPYHAAPGTSGVFHLACGYSRPIVASDLPEIRELVNHGASAVLVTPGNVEALKDALLSVLFDVQLADKMSEQNLQFAKKGSWTSVAKAYEDAYFTLLKQ